MVFYKLVTIFIILNYFAITPSLARKQYPFNVRGVLTPVFTPVNKNGNLDLSVISGYARYLVDNDIDGISIGSYGGEGPKLTVNEMKLLISAWLDALKNYDLTIIAIIGGRPFPDVVELAKYAERVRLDAIVTLPELFYKSSTPDQLLYETELVAKAAPNTPILYFDIPRFTFSSVYISEFYSLATERIPTFKGIGIDNCDDIIRVLPLIQDNQKLFICNSSYVAPAVYLGVDSFSFPETNIFPKLVKEIVDNGLNGNINETNNLYDELLQLSNAILSAGEEIPALKAAMTLITGIDVGPPRNPQQALDEDQEYDLERALKDLGQDIIID